MKMLKSSNPLPIKIISTAVRGTPMVMLGCLLAHGARAEVHIVRFDPPLSVDAYADPAPGLDWSTTAFDFDLDGVTDFRLTYGMGEMTAYFNYPTCVAVKSLAPAPPPPPGTPVPAIVLEPLGPVGAVPLNSMIGSNIVSSVGTNFYGWMFGYTNNDNLPELLGDHESFVIDVPAAVVPPPILPIITFSTNGIVTNVYHWQPEIFSDAVDKEAVIALQFYTGGQRHYGYIHFDFNGSADGVGGVIYGFAYETEPDVPIKAVPLLPGEKITKHKLLVDPFDQKPKHGHIVAEPAVETGR